MYTRRYVVYIHEMSSYKDTKKKTKLRCTENTTIRRTRNGTTFSGRRVCYILLYCIETTKNMQ